MILIPIFTGILVALIGAFMTAAEARACTYERNNIGPWLMFFGLVIVVGGAVEWGLS